VLPSSIFEAFCDVSDREEEDENVKLDEEKGEIKPNGPPAGGSAETLKVGDAEVQRASFSTVDSSPGSDHSLNMTPVISAPSAMRDRKPTFLTTKDRNPSPRRSSPRRASPNLSSSNRKSPVPGRRGSKYLDVPSSSKPRGTTLPSLFLRTQTQDIQVNDLGQSFRGHATGPRGVDLMELEGEVDESIAPSSNPSVVGISVLDWRLDGDVMSEVLNLKIRVGDEKTYRRLIQTLASFQ
jgi:hypothetical protein